MRQLLHILSFLILSQLIKDVDTYRDIQPLRWLTQLASLRSEGTQHSNLEDTLMLNIGGLTPQTFSLVQTKDDR